MFQQISSLIIEQGSLLDRVDHNIELTFENVKSGTDNLIIAERAQSQGGGCMVCLIIGLSCVVVFLSFLLIIKLRFVSCSNLTIHI